MYIFANLVTYSNEIAQLLSGLDVYKAPGPDDIGPLVLISSCMTS